MNKVSFSTTIIFTVKRIGGRETIFDSLNYFIHSQGWEKGKKKKEETFREEGGGEEEK